MSIEKQPTRQAPGIFTYMEFFSSNFLAYSIFFGMPVLIGFLSMVFNAIITGGLNFYHFFLIQIINLYY